MSGKLKSVCSKKKNNSEQVCLEVFCENAAISFCSQAQGIHEFNVERPGTAKT